MNREAKPMVENTSPKLVPDHCLFWNQYAPMVSSHAPQTKNWRKFITISRSFRLTRLLPSARIATGGDRQRRRLRANSGRVKRGAALPRSGVERDHPVAAVAPGQLPAAGARQSTRLNSS